MIIRIIKGATNVTLIKFLQLVPPKDARLTLVGVQIKHVVWAPRIEASTPYHTNSSYTLATNQSVLH